MGIPLPSTSESIISLMNTMCLSSLCTRETFIRSCPLKMKTPPHADLPLFEIDPNWFCQLYCSCPHVKVHFCCGAGYLYLIQTQTHPWMFWWGWLLFFVKSRCIGWRWVWPSSGRQIRSAWLWIQSNLMWNSMFHIRLAPSVNSTSRWAISN